MERRKGLYSRRKHRLDVVCTRTSLFGVVYEALEGAGRGGKAEGGEGGGGANRANTEPVNSSNICTWPDPRTLSRTRTVFYENKENQLLDEKPTRRQLHQHQQQHQQQQQRRRLLRV
uniref:Uncharacterized protein n=1 Tax=Vespula pensylvanica TaxID=30213 RepID=A0A834KHI9_VESPE|nr:hypothetical protein H0235_014421 [Vespula pensylvanica]